MVNKIIFDYLNQYHDKYKIEDLKKKILNAGYKQEDIDEALKLIESEKPDLPEQNKEYYSSPQNTDVVQTGEVKKHVFRWMKFAGLIGLFLIILSILVPALIYFLKNILISNIVFSIVFLSLSCLLMILCSIFFLYGFVKMGIYADSKALRFSSKSFIFLIIFGIIGLISAASFVYFKYRNYIIDYYSLNTIDLSIFTSQAFIVTVIIAAIILGIFFLYMFISYICFLIGLFKVSQEVKYTKAAGIFGILLLIVDFCILGILGITRINSLGNITMIISAVISGLAGLLGFIMYLFLIFSLFNASRKFESS